MSLELFVRSFPLHESQIPYQTKHFLWADTQTGEAGIKTGTCQVGNFPKHLSSSRLDLSLDISHLSNDRHDAYTVDLCSPDLPERPPGCPFREGFLVKAAEDARWMASSSARRLPIRLQLRHLNNIVEPICESLVRASASEHVFIRERWKQRCSQLPAIPRHLADLDGPIFGCHRIQSFHFSNQAFSHTF